MKYKQFRDIILAVLIVSGVFLWGHTYEQYKCGQSDGFLQPTTLWWECVTFYEEKVKL